MNSDRLLFETKKMPWVVASPGVEVKRLSPTDEKDRHTTTMIRLAPGATLSHPPDGSGREVIVLEGDWITEAGALHAEAYSRQPTNRVGSSSTEHGCTLFVEDGPFAIHDQEVVHSRINELTWVPGNGNLKVKPLHSYETTGAALVLWPAGERFVPHQHWGGEEILVLSGTFIDEHGRYPVGTWLRSPHMSSHHPFVEKETVIFVKTGHLLPRADSIAT